MATKELIIATWNIGGGHTIASIHQFDYVDHEDANYFINQLKKVNPDIVCLQESHANNTDSLTKRIASKLGMAYIFETNNHPSHIDANYNVVSAILSKESFTDRIAQPIPYPDFDLVFPNGKKSDVKHQKYLQQVNFKGLNVATVHGNNIQIFGYDYDKGEGKKLAKQVERVYLANLKRPLVFAADLNCDDVDEIYPEFVKHLSLRNALPEGNTRVDGRRTDYILASPEVQVIDSAVVRTNSDHYLCWAKCRFN